MVDLNPFDDEGSLSWLGDAGKLVGTELYKSLPVDNLIRMSEEIGKGNWLEAGKNLGIAGLETGLMFIPGGSAAKGAYTASRAAGRSAFGAAARALPRTAAAATFRSPMRSLRAMPLAERGGMRALQRVGMSRPGRFIIGAGGSAAGRAAFNAPLTLLERRMAAPGSRVAAAASNMTGRVPGEVRPTAAYGRPGVTLLTSRTPVRGTADAMERRAVAAQQNVPEAVASRMITDQVNATRARQGLPPIGGSTGSSSGGAGGGGGGNYGNVGGGAVALSPAEQAMLDRARSDALRQLNLVRAETDLERKNASVAAQEALRGAGRFGATSGRDLMAAAAEAGFSSSPAAYSVGLSDIAAEEARRRMAAESELASARESLRRRGSAAQLEYEKYLNDLAMQEAQMRSANAIAATQGRYGA